MSTGNRRRPSLPPSPVTPPGPRRYGERSDGRGGGDRAYRQAAGQDGGQKERGEWRQPPLHTQAHSPAVGSGQLPHSRAFWGPRWEGPSPPPSFHSGGGGGPPCCPSPGRVLKGGGGGSPTAVIAVLQPCPLPTPARTTTPPRPIATRAGQPCATHRPFWRGGLCVLIVKPIYPTLCPPPLPPCTPQLSAFLLSSTPNPSSPFSLWRRRGGGES